MPGSQHDGHGMIWMDLPLKSAIPTQIAEPNSCTRSIFIYTSPWPPREAFFFFFFSSCSGFPDGFRHQNAKRYLAPVSLLAITANTRASDQSTPRQASKQKENPHPPARTNNNTHTHSSNKLGDTLLPCLPTTPPSRLPAPGRTLDSCAIKALGYSAAFYGLARRRLFFFFFDTQRSWLLRSSFDTFQPLLKSVSRRLFPEMAKLSMRLDFQMESGGLGLLRSHSRARSGDTASTRGKTKEPPPAEPQDDAKEKKERSRSWFSPHRRKDSVASSILRSSKSLRRLSAISSSTSSQPAVSTPTTPSYSRGSYESDAAFHHRKLSSSVGHGDATRNGPTSEKTTPTDPPSIPYPPHRPVRPQEDLFEGTVLDKASHLGQQASSSPQRPSRSRSILRPFSPFPGPSMRDMRRLSQQSEHKPQANMAPVTAATNATASAEANQLSSDADQAHEPADAGTAVASSNASVFSDVSAPAPLVPGRRPSYRAVSNGSEAGVSRKGSIASSFHFPIHRRPSQVTAEIESRKHARSSRWTLTENMADMFNKAAPRIKTDKQPMTPSQIEAIWNGQDNSKAAEKKQKAKERRMKAASDTSAMVSRPFGGPLTEPQSPVFRDSFQWPERVTSPVPMSRADIKMRALPFEITVPPPPSTILVSPEIMHGDVSPKSPTKVDRNRLDGRPLPQLVLPEKDEAVVEDDDDDELSSSLVPVVPPKNPARFAARAPTMPLLPPIPEGFRSASDSKRSSKASGHRRSHSWNHASELKDEAVTFNSTPFTMTNPGFRHGPIVLSDAGSRDSVATTTEPAAEEHDVDWTAFQTAILGGASEDLDGLFPQETAQPDEEEGNLAEDVTTWFEGFGFETHGELIASEKSSQKKSERSTQRDSAGSMTSAASTPSTVQTDAEAEVQTPVSAQQHPNVFDTIKQLRNRCDSTYSASIYTTDSLDDPWAPAAADGEASRKSVGPLPPTSVGSRQGMERGFDAFLRF